MFSWNPIIVRHLIFRVPTTTHIGMTWRTFKDVEVPHGMNDNKEDQQDSAACQAKSII